MDLPRRRGAAPCRFYMLRGRCGYGQDCRFDHPERTGERVQQASREVEARRGERKTFDRRSTSDDPATAFRLMCQGKPLLWKPRQKRTFIQLAWDLSQQDSLAVLKILGERDGPGVQIIQSILGKCWVSAEASDNSEQVSLQRLFVPLLRLATCPSVLNSTIQSLVNPFLYVVGEAVDWEALADALRRVADRQTVEDSLHKDTQMFEDKHWTPTTFACIVKPIAVFSYEMVGRFEEKMLKGVEKIVKPLEKLANLAFESQASDRESRKLREDMINLSRLLESKRSPIALGHQLKGLKLKKKQEKEQRFDRWLRPKRQEKEAMYSELPGDLRDDGPRHDNDSSNISEISIAPTAGEVLCNIAPYLPPNRLSNVGHLPQGSAEAHRDIHFRLLRQDLIGHICLSIQKLKAVGGIQGLKGNKLHAKRTLKGVREMHEEDVNVHVYRNVSITDITVEKHSGVSYKVEFDTLPFLSNQSNTKRQRWWEKTKRLQHGTLCCLWSEGTDQGVNQPNIIFGIVSERKVNLLATNRPELSLRLASNPFDEKMVRAALGLEWLGGNEVIMLQAGPSFFAYEHILKALQHCPIPLSQYLLQIPEDSENDIVPQTDVGIPEYLDNAASPLDLSFMAENEHELGNPRRDRQLLAISAIDMTDPEKFPVDALTGVTTLDRAQAEALKAALTREVALIQGPPGTGKTYVGIQIVRAILRSAAARGRITPILCVCFTNHALDQFLLGLIESGIKNVIRVGGRVRDERLEDYNLRKKTYRKGTPDQWDLKNRSRYQLETLKTAIERSRTTIKRIERDGFISWFEAQHMVRADHPYFEDSLIIMGWDESELPHLWMQWLHGRPSHVYMPVGRNFHAEPVGNYAGEASSSYQNQFSVLADMGDDAEEHGRANGDEGWQEGADSFEPAGPSLVDWEQEYDETMMSEFDVTKEDIEKMEAGDRPLEELLETFNIWMMSSQERWRLHDHWKEMIVRGHMDSIEEKMARFCDLQRELKSIEEDINRGVLQGAEVVGMTTSGIAMHQQLVTALSPKIVIVEEAAEVLEAHILTSLSAATQHLILIGDHDQLRPKAQLHELQEESGYGFNLDISLFERLITQGHLPFATLQTQRRMRPAFSRLIRETVYPKLKDHESVLRYPENVAGMCKNLFFVDHDHPEDGQEDSKSKSNNFEAQFGVRLARYLVQQGSFGKGDIAIVTPYVGQLMKIRSVLSECHIKVVLGEKDRELLEQFMEDEEKVDAEEEEGGANNSADQDDADEGFVCGEKVDPAKRKRGLAPVSRISLGDIIRIATIDNFQGEEAKIVILSLVRNNKAGKVGFLGTKNRANVLLSRAMEGMYILGNAESLRVCKRSDMWKDVLKILKQTNSIGNSLQVQCMRHPDRQTSIKDWRDFDVLIGDGGCELLCGKQLPCGHQCPRRCHADDQDHSSFLCMKAMPIKLPCGHVLSNVPCHKAMHQEEIVCREMVNVTIPGCPDQHSHRVYCYQEKRLKSSPSNCKTQVKIKMPFCGHEITVACGNRGITKCTHQCGLQLVSTCGHECKSRCGDCIQLTNESLGLNLIGMARSSGETRERLAERMVHLECEKQCGKNMLCGHECNKPCHLGEDCPQCKKPCGFVCPHQNGPCGKTCDDPCVPCAEECRWECKHQGKCSFPCGGPCNRLPCDFRCEKKLECGCTCPGLCGEVCPSKDYCLKHATTRVKSQVVDYINLTSFGDLTEADVNEDPLVILDCGHVISTSSMDQHMSLDSYYEKENLGEKQKWLRPKPPPAEIEKRKVCMQCGTPIGKIFRYGRCINKVALDQRELHFLKKCDRELAAVQERLDRESGDLETLSGSSQFKDFKKAKDNLIRISQVFLRVKTRACRTPKVVIHDRLEAVIKAAAEENGASDDVQSQLRALGAPKPDLTRFCRSQLGIAKCGVLWLKVHEHHLNRQKRNTARVDRIQQRNESPAQAQTWRQLRHLKFQADRTFDEIKKHILSALKIATETRSVTSEILIYCTWIKLLMQMFHVLETSKDFRVAQARQMTLQDLEQEVVDRQQELLEEGKEIVAVALERATSDDQREEITSLGRLLETLETSQASDILDILHAVLSADPNMGSATLGQGHLHTCPNGHVYFIGECGAANDTGVCVECGEAIGAASYHQLAPGNRRADDLVRQLRERYGLN
ncbi:hypothetical protein BSKO_06251 [Bryopsis sp. KO-2023]|nr:hypothetical protein BSKO_06251 [Bryopsis sp. KO-2023]